MIKTQSRSFGASWWLLWEVVRHAFHFPSELIVFLRFFAAPGSIVSFRAMEKIVAIGRSAPLFSLSLHSIELLEKRGCPCLMRRSGNYLWNSWIEIDVVKEGSVQDVNIILVVYYRLILIKVIKFLLINHWHIPFQICRWNEKVKVWKLTRTSFKHSSFYIWAGFNKMFLIWIFIGGWEYLYFFFVCLCIYLILLSYKCLIWSCLNLIPQ